MTAQHRGSAGRISEDRIRPTPPQIKREIIDRFLKLGDLSSTVSDVLDEHGIIGAFGSSILIPTLPGTRIAGRAITVRNAPQPLSVHETIKTKSNYMTEVEGMHQAEPGDVLVIQGLGGISNMGGVMATTAYYHKLAGAVVDGGIRDAGQSRTLGFPIWSREISPVTGKWRAVTQEINGTVSIGGVSVSAGDLVIADETGVCFVPAEIIQEVLEACEAIHAKENDWITGLKNGMTIPELVKKIY
jgi:4-hydroxy-4-methyl-2-oxoglutarate aldolase